jgi:hypothetical protein
MAVYDRDADAATAVAAWLAQFAIDATGAITHDTGTDTFHVWWLHRALQKKVWDFATSGNDLVNLAKPNPSTSEALGTIITLLDHTTNYSVRYNITDTVAESHFGGSIEQQNGSSQTERYSGLIVLGSAVAGTQLQIVQNAALYTSFWGTGLNQTDSNTLLRILVKTIVAGAEVDQQIVVVKASEYGDDYKVWETTLGLGESVAAITTVTDPNNDTAIGTVQAYTGFAGVGATVEGYDLIDVDGNGADPFLGTLSYAGLTGNQNKKALYEVIKAYLSRGTTDTLFGIDGDLYTSRLFQLTVTPGSGSQVYVQNEIVTWTGAGEGIFLGADDVDEDNTTRIVIHLNKGIAPVNTDVITGATNAANNTVTSTEKLATNANYIGVYTGTNYLAAQGIGFLDTELIFGDSVTALDGETPTVPQNVTLTVNIECDNLDDPYVFLAEKDPVLAAPDYDKYAGETTGSSSSFVDIDAPLDADEPQTGYVGVLHTGRTYFTFYQYTDWNNTENTPNGRFNLSGTTDAIGITAGDDVFIGYFYEAAAGTGTDQSVTRSFVFDSGTREFVGWVRHGDPAIPDKPVPIAFNAVGSNSQTLTVVLDNES